MKEILIIAAEKSAEKYGTRLIEEFSSRSPEVKFFGVGGEALRSRGVEIVVDNRELSVVGIVEVLGSLHKIRKIMNSLTDEAVRRKPAAAILIDYPDFNLRFASKLHKLGIPVYQYISPTVWAWRPGRLKTIKKFFHHVFLILPFEEEIYKNAGIPHTYAGHPLVNDIKADKEPGDFKEIKGISPEKKLITLLPGSRVSEINFHMKDIMDAVRILRKQYSAEFILIKSDNLDQELIEAEIDEDIRVMGQADYYNAVKASDAVITSCGTTNLEAAVLGTPFVSIYRVNKLSWFLGKRFVNISRYSIVNILAGKDVVAELIQKDLTGEAIADEISSILDNSVKSERIKRDFTEIREALAHSGNPAAEICKKIVEDLK